MVTYCVNQSGRAPQWVRAKLEAMNFPLPPAEEPEDAEAVAEMQADLEAQMERPFSCENIDGAVELPGSPFGYGLTWGLDDPEGSTFSPQRDWGDPDSADVAMDEGE